MVVSVCFPPPPTSPKYRAIKMEKQKKKNGKNKECINKTLQSGVALALKIGGQNCHSFVFVTCFLYCHSIVFEYSNNTRIRLFSI